MLQQTRGAIKDIVDGILYAVPGIEGPFSKPIGEDAKKILSLLEDDEIESETQYIRIGANAGEWLIQYECEKCKCTLTLG